MGYASAAEFAALASDLDTALRMHLTSNHFPPLPVAYAPVAAEAISRAAAAVAYDDPDGWTDVLDLPDVALVPRESADGTATVGVLVEALHLHAFVDAAVTELQEE